MLPETPVDVVIVGAGLSGLLAAQTMQAAGWRVVLLEAADRVGGRLATHPIGPGRADSGAQFFTVRSSAFQQQVRVWLAAEWVYVWSRGWSDGSLASEPPDGHPRYAARGGMAALAAQLADGLDARLESPVEALAVEGNGWRVGTATQAYPARAVILTPPVPVTLALLAASNLALHPEDRAALAAVDYWPSLAGLFWVDGAVDLPEPGALQRHKDPVAWIANNRRKGISPDATAITLHAGPAYSQQLWDEPDDVLLAGLREALTPFLLAGARIVASKLVRWPHALPITTHRERVLVAQDVPPLLFAGDAFGGPRIEGAALSGLAAGEAVAGLLADQ